MASYPKIGPKTREAARVETEALLRHLRDYSRYTHRRAAMALREELHRAYCEANFGVDGNYVSSLDEADVLKAIADMIERDYSMEITTHAQLEAQANGRLNPISSVFHE